MSTTASNTPLSAAPRSLPTAPQDRIQAIDVLRGFALLGILVINIWEFGNPHSASVNAAVINEAGDPLSEWLNQIAFYIASVQFEGSMRALFSMLFGAGIVLLTSRMESDERRSKSFGVYYRRNLLLIGFGLVDILVFLWYGDIIMMYGIAGLLLYWVRGWSVRGLAITAGFLFVATTAILGAGSFLLQWKGPMVDTIEMEVSRGHTPDAREQAILDTYDGLSQVESDEEIAEQIEQVQGGYLSAYPLFIEHAYELQVESALNYVIWEVLCFMMLGMVFYKLQLFDASRSVRTYALLTVFGLAIGYGINYYEIYRFVNVPHADFLLTWTYQIGRTATALGYLGVVMLICKSNVLPTLRSALASVGQMALTNYLTQSLICLIIFVIFGLYGQLHFYQLYFVVFAIWALQIAWSNMWLGRYRYGPLEWLWRALTYGTRPLMTKK